MADHFFVYPEYLEEASSRALGRRLPRSGSVGPVTVDDIVAAARALGFHADAEPDHHYPRQSYRYGGRVKVAKQPGTSKAEFLRRVAAELLPAHPAHRKP